MDKIVITGKSYITSMGEHLHEYLSAKLSNTLIPNLINTDKYESCLQEIYQGPRDLYREQKIGLISVLKALETAGISLNQIRDLPVAILSTTTYGVERFKASFYRHIRENSLNQTSPSEFPYTTANSFSAQLAVILGMTGTNLTFSGSVLSASQALIVAENMLLDNKAEIVIITGENFFCEDFNQELVENGFKNECFATIILEKNPHTLKPDAVMVKIEKIWMLNSAEKTPNGVNFNIINQEKLLNSKLPILNLIEQGMQKQNTFILNELIGNVFSAAGIAGIILGCLCLERHFAVNPIIKDAVINKMLVTNMDCYGSSVSCILGKLRED